MKKFLNGIARVLCVMAVCVIAGCSYAGSGGGSTPGGSGNKPVNYTATKKGGLIGTSTQTQGTVIKETWMADNGNLKINETEIAKTSEVIAVPAGTVATVTMPDDSSWSGYVENKADSQWKGVFLKDRKIKLDPFVMSQYQVTGQLWTQIMGGTATTSIKPKANITWYKACAFCNELTKKTMTEADCVYYSNETLTTPYTATDAGNYTTPYIAYNTTTKKWTKTGYRLPTEAEWEFAARGGDPNAEAWSYAYAGSQTKKEASMFMKEPYNDDELENYAWYSNNAVYNTYEVGLKAENKLNLYDMSGNVREWCYDWYNDTASKNDGAYTVDGYVQNPLGSSSEVFRVIRGGCYVDDAYYCSVSRRHGDYPKDGLPADGDVVGFRVCRSTQ